MTADADTLYMGKFLLTHGAFGAVVLLLLVPKLTGHHRALHSTNAVIALWTVALGECLLLVLSRCDCSRREPMPCRTSNQELHPHAGLHGADSARSAHLDAGLHARRRVLAGACPRTPARHSPF